MKKIRTLSYWNHLPDSIAVASLKIRWTMTGLVQMIQNRKCDSPLGMKGALPVHLFFNVIHIACQCRTYVKDGLDIKDEDNCGDQKDPSIHSLQEVVFKLSTDVVQNKWAVGMYNNGLQVLEAHCTSVGEPAINFSE